MRPERHRGGLVESLITFFILLIVIGGGIAFMRSANIKSPQDFFAYVKGKSDDTKKCIGAGINKNNDKCDVNLSNSSSSNSSNNKNELQQNSTDTNADTLTNSQLNYSGPEVGQPYMPNSIKRTKQSFQEQLRSVPTQSATKTKFVETDWPHFINVNNSCWSFKNDVLYNERTSNKFYMLDANRNITSNVNDACSIKQGFWIDAYTGKQIPLQQTDIDYVIPLKYANSHGGSSWSSKKKQNFANDENNVSVVSNKSKKSRAGKSLSKWEPTNGVARCVLAKKFVDVASKYSLSISGSDKIALQQQLASCQK